jgi:hypothetical protein
MIAVLKNDDTPILTDVVPCKLCENYHPVSPSGGNCFYTTVIQRPDDYCSRAKLKSKIEKG